MGFFKDKMNEDVSEAKVIRNLLKSEFGLTNKDVSVKSKSGGYSSSIKVVIKTMKALTFIDKIEQIGKGKESYKVDQASQEILMGGNLFIFVSVDYAFEKQLNELIFKEYEKQSSNGSDTVLFKTFRVGEMDFGRGTEYNITLVKGGGVQSVATASQVEYLFNTLMQVAKNNKNIQLLSKIR